MIPERPRLHPRCHVLEVDGVKALRLRGTVLRVEDPARVDLTERALRLLDGRELEAVFAAFPTAEKLDLVTLLDELLDQGLLVHDGAATLERVPSAPVARAARSGSRDMPVAVFGPAGPAQAVAGRLQAGGVVGAHYAGERPREPDNGSELWALCLDAPDLSLLERCNRKAVEHGNPLVAGFPLGDEIVVAPLLAGGKPPCLRCFFLRWLGMVANVVVERAFLKHLAEGGWRKERLPAATADGLAALVARASIELVEGAITTPTVSITDLTGGTTEHSPLTEHPACDVCGPRQVGVDRTLAERWQAWADPPDSVPSLGSLGESISRLGGHRLGLVTDAVGRPAPGAADFAWATARYATYDPERVRKTPRNLCCGMARDLEAARTITWIEGLERYCLGAGAPAAIAGTYEELGEAALFPPDLPLYSERQYRQPGFPFEEFRPDLPLTWIEGYDLTSGRPVLLPEEVVSVPLERRLLLAPNSSGVAAHGSRQEALVSAILELVERDAFMLSWLLRRTPPRIDATDMEGAAPELVREIRAAGYRPAMVDLGLDLGIPVLAAFGSREDGAKPALLLGAGCALEPREAARKALTELAGAVFSWLDRPWKLRPALEPDAVRRLEDHGNAYAHPSWLGRAAFLWSSRRRGRLADLPRLAADGEPSSRLRILVDHLRERGFDVIAVDQTAPDVASAGLHIVRATVPGLQPIGFGRWGTRLGGRRLYEVANTLGRPCAEAELNPDPHCFP